MVCNAIKRQGLQGEAHLCTYYLCVADCKNGHCSLLPVSFTMWLYGIFHQEVGPIFLLPWNPAGLMKKQREYQQASSGPGPQEAPHASTRTPGSLPTPCMNKPGLACQRMKDHMEHGRATQLKPLRPVSPQPTQSSATAAYVKLSHDWKDCPAQLKLMSHRMVSE